MEVGVGSAGEHGCAHPPAHTHKHALSTAQGRCRGWTAEPPDWEPGALGSIRGRVGGYLGASLCSKASKVLSNSNILRFQTKRSHLSSFSFHRSGGLHCYRRVTYFHPKCDLRPQPPFLVPVATRGSIPLPSFPAPSSPGWPMCSHHRGRWAGAPASLCLLDNIWSRPRGTRLGR